MDLLVFQEKGQPAVGIPREKPLRLEKRASHKPNPHKRSMPELKPEPHIYGWQAGALTAVTSLAPQIISMIKKNELH